MAVFTIIVLNHALKGCPGSYLSMLLKTLRNPSFKTSSASSAEEVYLRQILFEYPKNCLYKALCA